jgi:GDP-4-dehydro-6-deoxy-D-mannose reductase
MIQYLKPIKPSVRIVGIDIRPNSNTHADVALSVDLCDKEAVRQALRAEPPDIVIHLAGLMPPETEQKMMHVNVDASVTLAESVSAVKSEKTRIVCAGSAAEYGSDIEYPSEDSACSPTSSYGRSKHEQTLRMLSLNSSLLEVIVARPFNLLGPGLSENLVAGGLCRQFVGLDKSNGHIAPKGPVESVRDFIDVRDVVSAYWTLATLGEPGQIYNVCTGRGTSIYQLIKILQLEFDVEAEVKPDYDISAISSDRSIGQNTKLQSLGWRPEYSIEDSVAAMVDAVNN